MISKTSFTKARRRQRGSARRSRDWRWRARRGHAWGVVDDTAHTTRSFQGVPSRVRVLCHRLVYVGRRPRRSRSECLTGRTRRSQSRRTKLSTNGNGTRTRRGLDMARIRAGTSRISASPAVDLAGRFASPLGRQRHMTPAKYRQALEALGLSVYAAAPILGISLRQAQRLAAGDSPVPTPIEKLIGYLLKEKGEVK
jgi:hypothetical protein